MRLSVLSWLAVLLWLTYGIRLWPLPPQEAAETVALYKRLMAESSLLENPEWKSQPDLEQKEGLRKYREFFDVAQEIIDRAPELKAHLWWQWAGRATLLVVAVLSWLYLAKLPRISRAVIALTTGILVVGQIVVYWSVYSDLVESWVAGHSGVKYLPWPNVLPMLYLLFVLPSILLLATVLAFRLGPLQEAHAK